MTTSLRAEQFVHASVLPAFSPAGRGGYQFVSCSTGISSKDREGLETLLTPIVSEDPDAVRWQGLGWEDGRWMILRSQMTPADAEICGGRKTKIVHGLIVESGQREAFLGMLAEILGGFPFVRSPRECVERFGAAQSEAPELSITNESGAAPATGWDGPMVWSWIRLAAGAGPMLQRGETLVLKGTSKEVVEALRLVFWLLPARWCAECRFDTVIDVDTARSGQVWMVGTTGRFPRGAGFIRLDPADRSSFVGIEAVATDFEVSPYGVWLKEHLAGLTTVSDPDLQQASVMKQAFLILERNPDEALDHELDEGALEVVDRLAGSGVLERIQRRFQVSLGAEVGRSVSAWLAPRLQSRDRVLIALGKAFSPAQAAGHAFDWLIASGATLKSAEWDVLRKLSVAEGHWGLQFLAAVWARPADSVRRNRALSHMDEETYRRILELCPDRVPPRELVSPPHGELLIRQLIVREVDDEGLANALLTLRKEGYAGPIPVSADRIGMMNRAVLKMLTEPASGGWGQDSEFRAALAARSEQLKKEPSLLARLIPWSRRRRNEGEDTDQSQER